MIEIVQNAPLSPIHLRARLAVEDGAAGDDGDIPGEPAFETGTSAPASGIEASDNGDGEIRA